MSFEEGEVIRMTVKYFNKRQDKFVNNFFPDTWKFMGSFKTQFLLFSNDAFSKKTFTVNEIKNINS